MNYTTWHTNGYGICTDDIRTTPDRIKQLLLLAPQFAKKISDTFANWEANDGWDPINATTEDYVEAAQEYDSGYYGLASLLRAVIYEAEGIDLVACDNFDCENYLVYEPRYPWQVTETHRDLTEDKLRDLFAKYVNVLTDEILDIEYQSVGNGG